MKLEEIEKLCDEATPGPWMETNDRDYKSVFGIVSLEYPEPKNYTIVSVGSSEYGDQFGVENQQDAKFIAESREVIPELVSRVRKLEVELEMVSKERDKLLKVAKATAELARCEGYYRDDEWEELNKALEELEKE